MCAVQVLRARGERDGVAGNRQIVVRDRRRAAGDQIADKLPGAAGHGPAKRAVAGVEPQIFIRCAADHRRAVRRHRPQARPESRLLHVAAAREQIAHHHLQGFATRLQQRFVKTDDLRHAADPNALIEAGDGDL